MPGFTINTSSSSNLIHIKNFHGPQEYQTIWQAMRDFTDQRTPATPDEIWLLQHHPVFTQGQAGKPEHLLTNTAITVIKSDRGGQITYHGPGQLIVYLLIDIKRRHLGVRELVGIIENSLIELLDELGIKSHVKKNAPGVYVARRTGEITTECKIASLGLRVRKGRSYHGLALNIDMDLHPFANINPCGHPGLAVTQIAELLPVKPDWQYIECMLVKILQKNLTAKPAR